ncbi:hypothetical protein [Treponema brennaborense]|uniref:Uncharacterized protein n=1 Tax=Treponema brennaborense (strain DSM 12168 / CIP 105900 / DD5/3) TaxID=906968 RepID=F4LND5_TREBD|nr:hypothetical protein [Treponema brennaborense]AEE17893.1 hypothetical protein Trebr_2487 [Treponema brennaborense DSM 12168]
MKERHCTGSFTELDGERFYKIENYDAMEDFFMTITSSSDIWNFCWASGGVTAGRIDCDHAIFPYYTADKVSDAKTYTGPYTAIAVQRGSDHGEQHCVVWEPFAAASPAQKGPECRPSIYKNEVGTKVWFEEINTELQISFRYGWTSSAAFGLVRCVRIENLAPVPQTLAVLDGCRNILPACVTADFQNGNSILLDAYKKTENSGDTNIALFSVSSIVTDKAEPNEGLFANVCWFTTDDDLILSPDAPARFAATAAAAGSTVHSAAAAVAAPDARSAVIKGKRPACYICRTLTLEAAAADCWYQTFDTSLDACRLAALESRIRDRSAAAAALKADAAAGTEAMRRYVADADGIQHTADIMACTHHTANVMFNIMRGGVFADNGRIGTQDFLDFIGVRNKAKRAAAADLIRRTAPERNGTIGDNGKCGDIGSADGSNKCCDNAKCGKISPQALSAAVVQSADPQLERLVTEYLPLAFSRRHGDPSRPWNRFSIKVQNADGSPVLNYEGNWRDIFQNWEALAFSYPAYVQNMCAKFLGAMTIDGFNPYRITREGIEWEEPEPDNPWAQIGYWGDHQIIYLEKLLELYSRTNRKGLLASLNRPRCATARVPYRLKPYADILKNPRETIDFDRNLSLQLKREAEKKGSDAKLVPGADGQPELVSITAKLLQIVIAKASNFVPGGGIWLNTQRPEWNDANNALAGYGLSVVTLCYLRRFAAFLIDLYENSPLEVFTVPGKIAETFTGLGVLYSAYDPVQTAADSVSRRAFTDRAGLLFEKERGDLYQEGFAAPAKKLTGSRIVAVLQAILAHAEHTIRLNRRPDGLFHAYNTMRITETGMELSSLPEMLEGQVAVLSSGMLLPEEALSVFKTLKQSKLFEPRQHSYLLYPDKELPRFRDKNRISAAEIQPVERLVSETNGRIIAKDCAGDYHFNADFRNVHVMEAYIDALPAAMRPTDAEKRVLAELYEKTFNHQNFTGRSGTFYAYEGLGSIYWHMVAKLLVAAQENVFAAAGSETAAELAAVYYDIRSGIGFNKTPELYGAFPADPYSHTPAGQGAKQPGMTGQVKEEIITRWGELGVHIEDGKAAFRPILLRRTEFRQDGTLDFTWCGVPVTYFLTESADSENIRITYADKAAAERAGTTLTAEETALLFSRDGAIRAIDVRVCLKNTELRRYENEHNTHI